MDKNKYTIQQLSSLLEAILFYTADHITAKKLSAITKSPIADVREALLSLQERLASTSSGIRLISLDDEYVIGTTPEASAIIEEITKEELSKELSKAALETLAIICYNGPLTRSEIDYIRGVNSTFILRNLLIRGIIEKKENPRDMRAALYAPTTQALEYMGITRIEELPDYEQITSQICAFKETREVGEEEKSSLREDSSDSIAVSCDVDGDGTLTAEECSGERTQDEQEGEEIYANVLDENLTAPQYRNDDDNQKSL
jgi:segregation and condensation protein B